MMALGSAKLAGAMQSEVCSQEELLFPPEPCLWQSRPIATLIPTAWSEQLEQALPAGLGHE